MLATNRQGDAVAWYVPAQAPEGAGSLCVLLDRQVLTNDLVMEVEFADQPGASLFLSLADTNLVEVATNVYGNLMLGSNELVRIEMPLPILDYASAAIIRLHRGAGEVVVYDVLCHEAEGGTGSTICQPGQGSGQQQGVARGPGHTITVPPDAITGESGFSVIEQPAPLLPAGSVLDVSPPADTNGTRAIALPPAPLRVRVIYVDRQIGHDSFSGLSPVAGIQDGPKKTVDAGVKAAVEPNDRLLIRGGDYGENLDIAGKNVKVFISGSVNLAAQPRYAPPPPVCVSTNYQE